MSEHLALRSSVGSRSSALPSHHQHQTLPPGPDPLASVWIRRLHLTPNPPPPPRPPPLPRRAEMLPRQDAISTDESRTPPPPPPRSAGFGPFRWSPRPLRGAPVGAWDAATAAAAAAGTSGGAVGGGPPMLSPFFRLPAPPPVAPVANIGEIAPVRQLIGPGSGSGSGSGSGGGGYPGLPTWMAGGGDPHASCLAVRAAGAAYPSHALDMIPIRTLNIAPALGIHGSVALGFSGAGAGCRLQVFRFRDLHDRQHCVTPQNFARHDPSSSSQYDEPFSYWNMGRLRRNTTTSSIPPIDVSGGNFGVKRNAGSNSFIPQKFRKLSGAI
ncbi:hypothetical protein ACP70R_024688 [Stipagrostis hirtigluma subsp. patula]